MESKPQESDRGTISAVAAKPAVLEAAALVLLSLATVGTAWCSFQAAAWGGAAQGAMNMSTASSRRAATDELQAYQMELLDVLLFSQYINARASSNENLTQFYADRFRGEAKAAFQEWMATRPFESASAPPHPFVTNLYQPRLLQEAGSAKADSQSFWDKAGEAGRVSRNYVLMTVLLASALFCGGTAAKFETLWIRRVVLALGLVAFIIVAGRLWQLPIQF